MMKLNTFIINIRRSIDNRPSIHCNNNTSSALYIQRLVSLLTDKEGLEFSLKRSVILHRP